MSSQEPYPHMSFFSFHKLCEIILFFPCNFSSSCASRPRLIIFSTLRPPRRLLGLRPLAKRRIYWLSWISEKIRHRQTLSQYRGGWWKNMAHTHTQKKEDNSFRAWEKKMAVYEWSFFLMINRGLGRINLLGGGGPFGEEKFWWLSLTKPWQWRTYRGWGFFKFLWLWRWSGVSVSSVILSTIRIDTG